MIYKLMKRKIKNEGLTDGNKELLDVFLAGGRITSEQYAELMGLGE